MAWYLTFYAVLLQTAVSGLLLLTVASLAVLAIREPARRIRIIQWTLAGLVIVPVVGLLPGIPHWSVLPRLETAVSLPKNAAAPVEPAPLVTEPVRTAAPMTRPVGDATGNVPAVRYGVPRTERIAMPAETQGAVDGAAKPLAMGRVELPTDYRWWIVVLYLTAVGAMVGWSAVGLLALARLLRSAEPADAKSREILREIAGPRSDRVLLLTSAQVGQPCAFAWRRATIVLPASLGEDHDTQKLRWALAHEWSHVERDDVWTWTASGLVRWIYCYQPLLWWLRGQLQLSQDFLADARAAGAGNVPEDYAEFLTSHASRFSRLAAGLGIGGRTSDLERRVVMLVENHRPLESTSPRKWNLAVLPIAVLFIVVAASLGDRPASGAGEPAPVPETQAKPDTTAPAPAAEPAKNSLYPQRHTLFSKNEAPQNTEQPAGPRRIRPGDELIVDAVAPAQYGLSLRPNMECVVDAEGEISLGSAYGRVKVEGKTLDEAELQIHNSLYRELIQIMTERRKRENLFTPPYFPFKELNVRVAFSRQSAAGVDRPRVPQVTPGPTTYEPAPQKAVTEITFQPAMPQKTTIAPGATLNIEVEGAPDRAPVRPVAVVEPDGNIALGVRYGRVNVQGKTLQEAEQAITNQLKKNLAEPVVQVTFANLSGSTRAPSTTPQISRRVLSQEPAEEVTIYDHNLRQVLNPLDTVEILLPLKSADHIDFVNGVLKDVYTLKMPEFSGTYLIEPEGDIALSHGYGRVNVKGLDVVQAGVAIRARLSEKLLTRTELPAVRVVKRGRAVFPKGHQPTPPYRVQVGDQLLIGQQVNVSFNQEVGPDGSISQGTANRVKVEGLSLADAQDAVQKASARQGLLPGDAPSSIFLTLGGWTEEADPEVFDKREDK